jgi:hypothetical protein
MAGLRTRGPDRIARTHDRSVRRADQHVRERDLKESVVDDTGRGGNSSCNLPPVGGRRNPYVDNRELVVRAPWSTDWRQVVEREFHARNGERKHRNRKDPPVVERPNELRSVDKDNKTLRGLGDEAFPHERTASTLDDKTGLTDGVGAIEGQVERAAQLGKWDAALACQVRARPRCRHTVNS